MRANTLKKMEIGTGSILGASLLSLGILFGADATVGAINRDAGYASGTLSDDYSVRVELGIDADPARLLEAPKDRVTFLGIDVENALDNAMPIDFALIAATGLATAGLDDERRRREREESQASFIQPVIG
jgi:hypothetical protein